MIAIKTMKEMPKNCLECPAFDNCEDCEGYMNACGITNENVGYIHDEPKVMIDKRPDSCPLIKITDNEDLIRRRDAIDKLKSILRGGRDCEMMEETKENCAVKFFEDVPSVQPEQRWIPFTTRPLTEEEKEEHPEWDSILDCKLPDDGQQILVSYSVRGHEYVLYDEFYTDDGCYLESGCEMGAEAVAWMPLPEPYKGK